MIGESIYRRLPSVGQNVACSIYGLRERRARMGRTFWSRYESLLESDRWTRQQIDHYQGEQLARLLEHAYANVPYYRRVFDELGLKPADVSTRGDLRKLPILQKEDVVRHARELLATNRPQRGLREVATSGTTGTALKFYTTVAAISFQWAIWWRHRWRFGIKPIQWHINFTGKQVVPIGQRNPPYWRWNLPMRQVLVGMQHINREKVEAIKKLADSDRFAFYSGYPSIVASFCEELRTNGLTLKNRPKCVFLGAEGIQEQQRQVIEEVTGALVTDQYGFSEGCGNASQCEHGYYHEDSEFGLLECVDGERLCDGRMRGKIVATGFSNYAFPFLRYEVGDFATWMPPDFICPCGRVSAVIEKIEGRSEDYVLTPEGLKIMRFDYLFKGTHGVKEAQVVQQELGAVVIRIVPRDTFSVADRNVIAQKMREFVSPTLRVEYEMVQEIPKSRTGKFRPVVSSLSKSASANQQCSIREA